MTVAGAAVVVNAMNPLYTRWETEALPLNTATIAIARSVGATLMLPGNVCNYGSPIPAVIDDSTPQRPSNGKGKVRFAMEAAVCGEGLRSIVVRAGDFFGGPGTGSWMDLAIARDLARGRITYPGPRDVEHAWAYLPDLARTFVLLAQARAPCFARESSLSRLHAVRRRTGPRDHLRRPPPRPPRAGPRPGRQGHAVGAGTRRRLVQSDVARTLPNELPVARAAPAGRNQAAGSHRQHPPHAARRGARRHVGRTEVAWTESRSGGRRRGGSVGR